MLINMCVIRIQLRYTIRSRYADGWFGVFYFMIVLLILGHWGFDGFETESLKYSPD